VDVEIDVKIDVEDDSDVFDVPDVEEAWTETAVTVVLFLPTQEKYQLVFFNSAVVIIGWSCKRGVVKGVSVTKGWASSPPAFQRPVGV
jgi:hypothetical protein